MDDLDWSDEDSTNMDVDSMDSISITSDDLSDENDSDSDQSGIVEVDYLSHDSDPSTSSSDSVSSEDVPLESTSEPVPSVSHNQQPSVSTTTNEVSESQKNPNKRKADGSIIEDAFSCSICLEGLTNTGPHKPACLKCGHIFGFNCLERWIKVGCNNDARRCPTCNTKATLRDIRILYAKNLIAIDTAELTALETKLSQEENKNNTLKSVVETWKVKYANLNNEVLRLKSVVDTIKSGPPSTTNPESVRQCLKKINLCKIPGCRVMAYNKHTMLLVASQQSDSPLFPSHVIRKVNAAILETSKESIFAHKKQIRDMSFHPFEHNVLASVGLDKCINLIDVTSNNVVSSIEVEEPLWSCCWAGNNSNMLIAGGQMGSLFYIDRRFMKLLYSQCMRKPACVSLVPLPPSSTRSFVNGGFLKTRLDVLSVFEQKSGQDIATYEESELPLRGLWTNTSFDNQSNLILTTAKPCGINKSVRHIVSKISNSYEKGPVIHPVATFYGGCKATQLSRSCLVPSIHSNEDTLVCSNDETSSSVKLFSVNSSNNVHNFQVKENFLDFCPLTGVIISGRRTVAGLSDNSISIFAV